MSGENIFLVLRNKIITYEANTKLLFELPSSSSTEPIIGMIQLAFTIMSYDYYVGSRVVDQHLKKQSMQCCLSTRDSFFTYVFMSVLVS